MVDWVDVQAQPEHLSPAGAPGLVAPGLVELEAVGLGYRDPSRPTWQLEAPLRLKFGMRPGVQGFVGWESLVADNQATRTGGIELGGKFDSGTRAGARTAVTLGWTFRNPTPALGTSHFRLDGMARWSLGPFALDARAGVQARATGVLPTAALALGTPTTEGLGLVTAAAWDGTDAWAGGTLVWASSPRQPFDLQAWYSPTAGLRVGFGLTRTLALPWLPD